MYIYIDIYYRHKKIRYLENISNFFNNTLKTCSALGRKKILKVRNSPHLHTNLYL